MVSATGERLITKDTVAGDRPRCSASSFKLTGFRLFSASVRAFWRRLGFLTLRSLAQFDLCEQIIVVKR
jgi:hypothetical protein